MSRWFRMYDEALDDPKVQRLAPNLFKAWVNLLCLASKSGGDLPPIPDIGFKLRITDTDAQSIIDELVLVGLIDIGADGRLSPHNWKSRQQPSDSSKERTRKWRKSKDKLPCDVTVTAGDENGDCPEIDSEVEKEGEVEKEKVVGFRASAPDPKTLKDRLEQAAGPALANPASAPGLLNLAIPIWWIEQGCDLERDILPTLTGIAAKRGGKQKIASWEYFTAAVANAKAKREQGLPAVDYAELVPQSKQPTVGPLRALLNKRAAEAAVAGGAA